jgi:hypothetical protein
MQGKWLKSNYVLQVARCFLESGNKSYHHVLEAEIEKLQSIIGEQAIQIEVQKTDELFQKR